MRTSTTWGMIATALAGALLLSGCATAPLGVPEPAPLDGGWPTVGDRCGGMAPEPWTGQDGDFAPVAALTCEEFGSVEDAQGTWTAVVTRRLTGDLDAVLTAAAGPDDAPWNGACTADMVIEPPRWLVDTEGRGVAVAEPRDGCGKPKGRAVELAFERLEEVDRRTVRVRLEQSRAADAAGCPTWHTPMRMLMIDDEALQGIEGIEDVTAPEGPMTAAPEVGELPPGAVLGAPFTTPLDTMPVADGLRLCRYEDGAAPAGDPAPASSGAVLTLSGQFFFVDAQPLEPSAAATVLGLVERDRASDVERCAETAERAVVLLDARDASIAVELDGCRAIGMSGGAASEELLGLLTSP